MLPRSHWGAETDFEMAGAAVAHSILSSGLGFPFFHPAVYAHLAVQPLDSSNINVSDLPCAEDIPLDAATADLKQLIDQVVI